MAKTLIPKKARADHASSFLLHYYTSHLCQNVWHHNPFLGEESHSKSQYFFPFPSPSHLVADLFSSSSEVARTLLAVWVAEESGRAVVAGAALHVGLAA